MNTIMHVKSHSARLIVNSPMKLFLVVPLLMFLLLSVSNIFIMVINIIKKVDTMTPFHSFLIICWGGGDGKNRI